MEVNVPEDFSKAEVRAETPWCAADARLSETVDSLHRLVDHMESRLELVMSGDVVPQSNPPEYNDRAAPVVKSFHHYADRIFDVNERLAAILDRLDI